MLFITYIALGTMAFITLSAIASLPAPLLFKTWLFGAGCVAVMPLGKEAVTIAVFILPVLLAQINDVPDIFKSLFNRERVTTSDSEVSDPVDDSTLPEVVVMEGELIRRSRARRISFIAPRLEKR